MAAVIRKEEGFLLTHGFRDFSSRVVSFAALGDEAAYHGQKILQPMAKKTLPISKRPRNKGEM